MVTRQGYMKFWRLGTLEFGEQDRWSHAPKRRGFWAFPYPFFDEYFAYHKFTDIMPKRLSDDDSPVEDAIAWIENVGRRVVPVREFWYKGDVFSHFKPNGERSASTDDFFRDGKWSVTDVDRLRGFISSSGSYKPYTTYDDFDRQGTERETIDHLEVFIAPGMGQIRDGKTVRRGL
jgi:hypothetical protein